MSAERTHTEVELPGMPVGQRAGAHELDNAVRTVEQGLEGVRTRLAVLREQRAEINTEIKRLVGEEKLLYRMVRVAEAADG